LTVSRQGRGLVQAIDVRAHVDPRGIPYHWLQFSRAPRADVDDAEAVVVARGAIAVTPLQFERTADDVARDLAAALGGRQ
jgi:5'-nucleotidase